MVQMLKSRYEQEAGNGRAGAVIPQVRNDAGFDAKRTIDALAFSFWPSRGLLMEGFECKSSRSDWQRELADPSKAEEFCTKVDKFWIIAGAKGIVLEDELPPEWGLLVARGTKLVQVRPAKALRDLSGKGGRRPLPPGFDRGFLIALIRQATIQQSITPAEIDGARRRGFEEGEQHAGRMSQSFKDMYEQLYADVQTFQKASGISVSGYSWPEGRDTKAVGAAVRTVLNGEHEATMLESRLERVLEQTAAIAQTAQAQLDGARQLVLGEAA